METHIVIMAGGIGSRFWPMSTPECPKQFIDVTGCGKSLLLCQFAYQQGSLFLGYDISVQSLYHRLFQMRCVYNAVITFIQSDIFAYDGIVPVIFGQQGM